MSILTLEQQVNRGLARALDRHKAQTTADRIKIDALELQVALLKRQLAETEAQRQLLWDAAHSPRRDRRSTDTQELEVNELREILLDAEHERASTEEALALFI